MSGGLGVGRLFVLRQVGENIALGSWLLPYKGCTCGLCKACNCRGLRRTNPKPEPRTTWSLRCSLRPAEPHDIICHLKFSQIPPRGSWGSKSTRTKPLICFRQVLGSMEGDLQEAPQELKKNRSPSTRLNHFYSWVKLNHLNLHFFALFAGILW